MAQILSNTTDRPLSSQSESAETGLGRRLAVAAAMLLTGAALPTVQVAQGSQAPTLGRTQSETGQQKLVETRGLTQLYKQLGAAQELFEIVDRRFNPPLNSSENKSNAETKSAQASWNKERPELAKTLEYFESRLSKGALDQQAQEDLTRALSAFNGSMRLYLEQLTAQKVQQSNQAPTSAPTFGTYDRADFLALINAARLAKPILAEQLKRSGSENAPLERGLLEALDKLSQAQDPDTLSKALMPEIEKALGGLKNLKGAEGQVGAVGMIRALLEQTKAKGAGAQESKSAEMDDSAVGRWSREYTRLLSRDKTVRLNPQGRAGYQERVFQELVRSEAGFKLVKDSAAEMQKTLSPEAIKFDGKKALLETLTMIATAKSVDELPSESREIMDQAHLRYIQQMAQKKAQPSR